MSFSRKIRDPETSKKPSNWKEVKVPCGARRSRPDDGRAMRGVAVDSGQDSTVH